MSNKIQTYTGRYIDPFNLKEEDIDIRDIAHSLSNQNRYNGHTLCAYNVAHHSIALSRAASDAAKLWALLHDAGEAYIGDVPTPIKKRIKDFGKLEAKIEKLVIKKFSITFNREIKEEVHTLDKDIVIYEKNAFLNPTYHPLEVNPFPDVKYPAWNNELSEYRFLQEFYKHV